MPQQNFSVIHLMPHFSEVFQGNFSSSHGLSAAIVLFLLVVAIGFLSFAISKYLQAKRQILFYETLVSGINQSELAGRQREITQNALQHSDYGKLWKEFDETLVISPDGTRLFNTLDAEHFFNNHTLARGLTENRLLAAVPGFLTAIGVIGTFAGLQMGLGSLELSQQAGVEALQQGIGHMIKGASVAFLTSVWGVFTSVLFNFIEKMLERGVKKRIANLQNLIDYLYPRINAEQSLVSIVDHTRNSSETLQGLAEKIGDRLQESLLQVSDNIRTGLEESLSLIMAPAIQSLVENANSGSQQVLDSLLNKFLDGIGDAGTSQRKMMQEASRDVQVALSGLGDQMSGFLKRLDEQSRQTENAAIERQAFLEKQLEALGEQQTDRQRKLGESFENIFEKMVEQLNQQQNDSDLREKERAEQLQGQLRLIVDHGNQAVENIGSEVTRQFKEQQTRDEARQKEFADNVTSMQQIQNQLMDRVEFMLSNQKELFDAVHRQMVGLQEQFKGLAEAHSLSGNEVSNAAQQMRQASNQLGLLSANIRQATEVLSRDVAQAAETTAGLADENRKINQVMQETLQGYGSFSKEMDGIADKLNLATASAQSGFEAVHKHLDHFKNSLKAHIEEVEDHVAKLLSDYAATVQSQTGERMREWNAHTNEYIAIMTNAVKALSDVVDGMETKCSAA
ncbi:MAG: anti-phage ZorAB system protein ZorA [Syntrophotaleaceae bacterium]